VLTVRAVFDGGAEDEATALVTVANQAPPPLAVRAPLPDGSTVTGTVHVVAPVEGSPERVEFWVDGTLRHVERSAPYEFDWDASREQPGTHTLLIRAVSGDRSTSATQTLTVPAPAPPPAPTVTLPLADGQTLAGTVHVVAEATGKPARVEFSVDGRLRHVERSAPYEFDWDTTREADGAHTLQAKAVSDAGSGTASATVTVANRPVEPEPVPQPPTPESPPPPEPSAVPAFAVQSSLADGATVTGTVRIEATVTGEARRVEVWVDGRRRAIDYGAPWAFDWDTTRFADGRHTVVLRARARDGSTVEATAVVVVANGS